MQQAISQVTSRDGTVIAYEGSGDGPPVIFVVGAFNDRQTGAPLAELLARDFTVFTYDRRGRGDSGDTAPPRGNRGSDGPLKSEDAVFATPQGDVNRILVTGRGAGLVDFAVIPHLEHPHHPDASLANAEQWAARIAGPTYAIDDETAISVVGGAAHVVSEGQWKLFRLPRLRHRPTYPVERLRRRRRLVAPVQVLDVH